MVVEAILPYFEEKTSYLWREVRIGLEFINFFPEGKLYEFI